MFHLGTNSLVTVKSLRTDRSIAKLICSWLLILVVLEWNSSAWTPECLDTSCKYLIPTAKFQYNTNNLFPLVSKLLTQAHKEMSLLPPLKWFYANSFQDLIQWKCLGKKKVGREDRPRLERNRKMEGKEERCEERWGRGEKGDTKGGTECQEHMQRLFSVTWKVAKWRDIPCPAPHSAAIRRHVTIAFERVKYSSHNFESYCLSRERSQNNNCVSVAKMTWQGRAYLEPHHAFQEVYGRGWFKRFQLSLFPKLICPRTLFLCCQQVGGLLPPSFHNSLSWVLQKKGVVFTIQNLPMLLCLGTPPRQPMKGQLSSLARAPPLIKTPGCPLSWGDALQYKHYFNIYKPLHFALYVVFISWVLLDIPMITQFKIHF